MHGAPGTTSNGTSTRRDSRDTTVTSAQTGSPATCTAGAAAAGKAAVPAMTEGTTAWGPTRTGTSSLCPWVAAGKGATYLKTIILTCCMDES